MSHWSFALLEPLCRLAREAGAETMAVYTSDFQVTSKEDKSPVTEADKRAEKVILAGLAILTPDIPVVAEESVSEGRIPEVGECPFWLVDPVDGTKEFINRRDEFTVNIGLIENGQPVCGVVFAPALDKLYAGAGPGTAFLEENGVRRPIRTKAPDPAGVYVVGSRSHGDPEALKAFLGDTPVLGMRSAGSSLKFCLVAAGEADVYPRHGPTSEWDTAAGHAVVLAAGGVVVRDDDGTPLTYAKPTFRNPFFIVWAKARG